MPNVQIAVGEEFFEELRRENCYYVDKTEMIYQIARAEKTKVTLFTRPRRFGKTLTMSMFQSFFDITRDSKDMFDGLAVTKHTEFCEQWMNQYPVLFISLKDVAGLEYGKAYEKLAGTIANLCKAHAYLEESNKVNKYDITVFSKLQSETANASQLENSLLTLTRMMHAHYGKPVILLIDEYDVPLAKAHDADKGGVDYYPKMLDTIKGLLSGALKTNEFLKLAVVTGCLRISKESIFTGVNNFKTYGILDAKFSNAFGFTEIEVKRLLKDAGCSGKLDIIQKWYDGYIFGNSEMFCPWDVLNFVSDLSDEPDLEPQNYWKDTSDNGVVGEFIGDGRFAVSGKFEKLMNNGTIRQTITDQLTYGNLANEEDNLWSVLFMTGYLTKADKSQKGSTVDLKIPNTKIASIFKDSIVSHFNHAVEPDTREEIMYALWNGDADKVSALMTDLLFDTISYFDYHEDYYHAFMTGLIVSNKGYEVDSNQENGLGRTDIIVRDRKNRRAIIIETKKSNSEFDMEKDAALGKRQIIEKKYIRGLKGFQKIRCYGIAFHEKSALAKLLDMSDVVI